MGKLEISESSYNIEDLSHKEKNNNSMHTFRKAAKELAGRLLVVSTCEKEQPIIGTAELFLSGPADKVKRIVLGIKALIEDENIN